MIPIPHGEKGPRIPGWQNLRLTEGDLPRYFNGQPMNFGMLLGKPSGYLVDVDLDCPEAVEVAAKYLPSTGAIFGREGNPRSHYLYRVDRPIETIRLKDGKATVIEYRGDGAQTVAPGSVHPSGEAVRWDEDGEPATVDADDLLKAVDATYKAVLRKRGRPIPEADPAPLLTAETRHTATTATIQATDDPKVIDRAAKYLDRCDPAIAGQSGHDALLYAACRLVNGFALTPDAALALLRDRYNPRCVPPWSEAELLHKVSEAGKIPHDQPRGHLLNDDRPEVSEVTSSTCSADAPDAVQITMPPILSIDDLREHHGELDPPIIDGLLRKAEILTLVAASKAGKSWLTMNMIVSVATGADWLRFPTEQSRVLLIDNELKPNTILYRLEKVAEARCVSIDDLKDRVDVISLRGNLAPLSSVGEWVSRITGYDLIVLDAAYRFAEDGEDENGNSDMVRRYNLLDRFAAITGAAFVVVDHSSKGSQTNKAITDVGAGAGAKSRATDTHLVLRPHKEPGCFTVEGVTRTFIAPEASVWRFDFPVWVEMRELDPGDMPGKVGRPAKDAPPPKPKPEPWTVARFVDEVMAGFDLHHKPPTRAQLELAADGFEGLSKSQAHTLLKAGLTEGRVHEWVGGGNVQRRYSTHPEPLVNTAKESKNNGGSKKR